MRERLYYNFNSNGEQMKDVLKTEAKYSKRITIYNKDGDELGRTSKFEVYSNYVDFELEEPIEENLTKKPGCIEEIVLKEVRSLKGDKYFRIDKIIA